MDIKRYGPWALIAGGSEGIGAAFAHKLAAQGVNLVLVARKPEPLDQLARDIRAAHAVTVHSLALDLTLPDAHARVRAVTDGLEIGLLVHNAGSSDRVAEFLDQPMDVWLRLITLNVVGQTAFVHHYGGLMRQRGRGGVILMGSIAGVCGANAFAVYAAAKAYTHVLAEGLWRELAPHGVHVLGLVAGNTRTPSALRMGLPMDHPLLPTVESDEVAEAGLAHLADGPLYIMPKQEDAFRHLRGLSPREAATLVGESTNQIFGLS